MWILKNREETFAVLSEVIRQRGHLVASCSGRAPLGIIVNVSVEAGERHAALDHPFRVMTQTDRRDWDEQAALIETLCSDVVPRAGGPFFYRVMTD
jgi:hypothetical protein